MGRSRRGLLPARQPAPPWTRHLAIVAAAALVVGLAQFVHLANPSAPTGRRPALSEVDLSVRLAERYADGLYKPLPGNMAVQSEDYGFPLRTYYPAERSWVLLGQGATAACLTGTCAGPTTITAGRSSVDTERFGVSFDSPRRAKAVRLRLDVDWGVRGGGYAVSLTGSNGDRGSAAVVYLDTRRLLVLPASGAQRSVTVRLPASALSLLKSLRYTVRHATQEAFLYWRARGDAARAGALAHFLRGNGYRPGIDIRAAIFGTSRGLPDNLPYVSSGPDGMYPDCNHLPRPTPLAYPYHSKVCLLKVPTFIAAAKFDPFTQAAEALAVLTNHRNPDYRYPTGGSGVLRPAITTPREVARYLERLYDEVGNGEPSCLPSGCDKSRASALRTFHFGVLEAVLGYRYADQRSRRYADAVATMAIRTQVGTDGIIRSDGRRPYRPAQVGAFPIYWNARADFVPTTGLAQAATDRLSMPPEYSGQVPSDTETTLDGWAFLTAYRCLAFHAGCAVTAWRQA